MKKNLLLKIGFALLILVPTSIAYWLSTVNKNYDVLLNKYECVRNLCEADFDGDGFPGTLTVSHSAPLPQYDSWLVVVDSDKELLRLPRRNVDNSLRTHAAINIESGVPHLVVYDFKDRKSSAGSVFAYNGERMVAIAPSAEDGKILDAMSARDDSGSFHNWVLFESIIKPAVACYVLLIGIAGCIILTKRQVA
jgi:hypothetical protein